MKIKDTRKVFYKIAALFITGVVLFGCAPEESEKSKSTERIIKKAAIHTQDDDLAKAKSIIFSLPSPLETAILLKRVNAKYNADLLNPHNKSNNYNTQKAQALNMGIYLADLCYASIHEQNQTTIHYMLAAQDIADNLGLLNLVDVSVKDRLEANYFNRDSVIYIISETLMNSNAFLQENKNSPVHSIVLYGGWIEGLYLATEMAKEADKMNVRLYKRILDQGISLEILHEMIEKYEETANVDDLLKDLKQLEKSFLLLDESLADELDSETVNPELSYKFDALFNLISITRNKYTS